MDAARVLEAIVGADKYLGGELMIDRVERSADDRREPGIDQTLPADDDEDSRLLWIPGRGFAYAEEVSACHRGTW